LKKIYLDNCCFNRPYDDQTQLKIHLETQAKLDVQNDVLNGLCELIWSYILEFENNDNPYEYKRILIKEWKELAKYNIRENEEIIATARKIMINNITAKDALHIACAIYAKADYFLTTDTKLLKSKIDAINIINPLDYIRGKENENE